MPFLPAHVTVPHAQQKRGPTTPNCPLEHSITTSMRFEFAISKRVAASGIGAAGPVQR